MKLTPGRAALFSVGVHAALGAVLAARLCCGPVGRVPGPVEVVFASPVALEAPEPEPPVEPPPRPRVSNSSDLFQDFAPEETDARLLPEATGDAIPTAREPWSIGLGGGARRVRPPRAEADAVAGGPSAEPEPPAPAPAGPTVRARPLAGACRAPDYPDRERRLGIEGVVELLATVAPDGSVEAVAVLRSSGRVALDRAAAEAVRGWRFQPALCEGVAVRDEVVVPMRFVLVPAAAR